VRFNSAGDLVLNGLIIGGTPAAVAAEAVRSGADVEVIVRRMLDVGSLVLQHGDSRATVDSVAAEIDRLIAALGHAVADELPKTIESNIESLSQVFSEHLDPKRADSFQQQLAKVLGESAKAAQDQLIRNLLNDTGPLGVVKAELAGRLQMVAAKQDELLTALSAVSERVAARGEIEAERDRGTAKGVEYESLVGAVVDWAFAPYTDVVEDVGTTAGATGSKTGDHLVYLNQDDTAGLDLRVVVEAKCRKLGARAALNELDRAMENREAEAGILVFASVEDAPLKGRSMRLYPGNRILAVFDPSAPETLPLETACHLARALAIKTAGDEEFNVMSLSETIGRLTEVLEDAKAIKRGVNAARKGIDQVDSAYEQLRLDALSLITEINDA
jgi:hypothetical protein